MRNLAECSGENIVPMKKKGNSGHKSSLFVMVVLDHSQVQKLPAFFYMIVIYAVVSLHIQFDFSSFSFLSAFLYES